MLQIHSKAVDDRLASIEGHVKGVRKMVEEDKPCEDIILQLSAIESAVNKIAKGMIKDHLNHCVKDSIQSGDSDALQSFGKVLDRYL